jgi:hypothetical protein
MIFEIIAFVITVLFAIIYFVSNVVKKQKKTVSFASQRDERIIKGRTIIDIKNPT